MSSNSRNRQLCRSGLGFKIRDFKTTYTQEVQDKSGAPILYIQKPLVHESLEYKVFEGNTSIIEILQNYSTSWESLTAKSTSSVEAESGFPFRVHGYSEDTSWIYNDDNAQVALTRYYRGLKIHIQVHVAAGVDPLFMRARDSTFEASGYRFPRTPLWQLSLQAYLKRPSWYQLVCCGSRSQS